MCNLSPIHIGTGRESYDTSAGELQSDTLSAALAAVGVTTGLCPDPKALLSSLKISSAFPYWGETYFLPKPQGRLNAVVDGLEDHAYRKHLKAVRYVATPLWQSLAAGMTLHIDSMQVRGQFLIPADTDMGQICRSQVNQRVGVARDGATDAEPFFFEWHYYDKRAGLYCLLDADDAMMRTVIPLFEALGETGIGTDKSVGGGKFTVAVDAMDIAEPHDADSTMLLSLYIPTEDEHRFLFDGEPRYTLMRRGGYMAGSSTERFRHLRRKTVYAFGTGSTFQTTTKLEGKIVDVAPEWNDSEMHPVYRSGRPLTIKIKTGGL